MIRAILIAALLLAFSVITLAAPLCRSLFHSSNNPVYLTETKIAELVDNSKTYQDKRNKEWAERNKCLCCHTTLPYMLSRTIDVSSKATLDKFKEVAAFKVENPEELPWYHVDRARRNSKPTEAVLNAITLVMHDIKSQSPLSATTLKSMDRIFETVERNGRLHWLDFNLQPFESKKGELWGNSMAVLAIELARKHSNYVPPHVQYNKLKSYLLERKEALKPQEMAVLLWANSQVEVALPVLTPQLKQQFVSNILESQSAGGSWSQKAALGYGTREGSVYATAISLIGLIKAGFGNHPSAHRAAKWIADNQATGNFLQMGDGTVLWRATSMNRTNSLFNDRFASDFATSYAALALSFYKSEVLELTRSN